MRYLLDPAQGRFTVQAFARGLLSALGHSPTFAVREFTGDLRFTPDASAQAAFHLSVKADSLALTDSVSPKDREEIEGRMRQEVLETARYPEIIFQGTEITADRVADNWYRLRLNGEMRLHGVTSRRTVDIQFRILEDQARVSGQCVLSQAAHRIKPVTALGGMIKLKDELNVDFDLVGHVAAG
jgi:polyisoprenoid-binding protein YceI